MAGPTADSHNAPPPPADESFVDRFLDWIRSWFTDDTEAPMAPPGTPPPGGAEPPKSIVPCDKMIEKALARAAEKGPRKAYNAFKEHVAFDSIGLPGSRSLQGGVQNARGSKDIFSLVINGILGSEKVSEEWAACNARVLAALEEIYGPKADWSKRGGGGIHLGGGGGGKRRAASGAEFADWQDQNHQQRSQSIQEYSARRIGEIEAATGRTFETYSSDRAGRLP